MTDSMIRLFNSGRLKRVVSIVIPRKMVQAILRGTWLLALVAAGYSAALCQNSSMGVQEFMSNSTFTVPTGVSSLRVDAYGAGGGGGGEDSDNSSYGGGCGGAGAYAAGVITVSPGEVLTIVVGKGGKGGAVGNPGTAGSPGGATQIVNSSNVVLFSANGGKGGQGATSTGNGAGGAGGAAGTFGSIHHAGQSGSLAYPGYGYIPVGFNIASSNGFGLFGVGGSSIYQNPGQDGSAGYLLIAW
jgi:hypothetical protein